MRILTAILMLLAGAGAIAWSYLGAFAKVGEEMSLTEDPFTAFFRMLSVIEAIAAGDFPQMTGFLYGGLLLIAVAVVMLFFGKTRNRNDEHSL